MTPLQSLEIILHFTHTLEMILNRVGNTAAASHSQLLLSGFEIIETASQEDVVFVLGVVVLVAVAPVVAHGVGEDVAVLVEGALGDGQVTRLAVLELGPGVLVPTCHGHSMSSVTG